MILRLIATIILAWLLGFLGFAITLPGPITGVTASAAVIPTGAAGRIQRGVELLEEKQVDEIFISGVDADVTPEEFAVEFEVSRRLMNCCVTLGFEATDTRGNAEEIADWVEGEGISSIRLVTSDWHMRRAVVEVQRRLPAEVAIIRDAVPSTPSLAILFVEYHKFLASSAVGITDELG